MTIRSTDTRTIRIAAGETDAGEPTGNVTIADLLDFADEVRRRGVPRTATLDTVQRNSIWKNIGPTVFRPMLRVTYQVPADSDQQPDDAPTPSCGATSGPHCCVDPDGHTDPHHAHVYWTGDDGDQEAAPCIHCPDGHTPPTGGTEPWKAYVGLARDGDDQPTQIVVMRAAGAHVAESDAEWVRGLLRAGGAR